MNERIKELADQVLKDTRRGLNFEEFYEKFAELIVKECASVADGYVRDGDWDIAVIIKRHFGVKE